MSASSESYFCDGLAAGTGGVRIHRRDGSVDLIAGNRDLEPSTAIRAEISGGMLRVIYLGVVLAEYDDWTDYGPITTADYPLGA